MRVLVLNNTVNYAGSNISFLKLAEGLKYEGVEFYMAGPKVENHYFRKSLLLRCINILRFERLSSMFPYPISFFAYFMNNIFFFFF